MFQKGDTFLRGACFEMVGARPSMPDTFDGYGVLAQPRNESLRAVNEEDSGNTHRITKKVGGKLKGTEEEELKKKEKD